MVLNFYQVSYLIVYFDKITKKSRFFSGTAFF